MNIAMLLEMAADGFGDRVAVGTPDDGLTFAELLDRARRAATVVMESGAERLGMLGANSTLLPTLLFASGVAGVPFVPINYRLTDDRVRGIVDRVGPAMMVADDGAAERIRHISGVNVVTPGEFELRLATAAPASQVCNDPDQVAVWLFTSGTTGEPKAALLRHRHLTSYVLTTIEFMAADADEATLVSVPPYHIAGIATILSNTYSGRRIVYLPQFDSELWVRVAEEEAITHAMVVPTMLGRILDEVEEQGATLKPLSYLSYGGGRMPVPIVERAMRLLPHVGYVNAYGLTETSSTVAVLGPEDHRVAFGSDDPAVRARLGSVGRPLATLELEIRDAMGNALPAGASGEICVRGEQIAGEYQGRSSLTADGWFPTNDGGHLDEAGFLFVEGRLDDVIVRGGENLSPGEIEDVLLQHPAVAAAAVTGIPDQEWGEAVAAAVVLTASAMANETELQCWVRDRLRSARTPVFVQFREELPYNETGKLLRRVLKQQLAEVANSSRRAR